MSPRFSPRPCVAIRARARAVLTHALTALLVLTLGTALTTRAQVYLESGHIDLNVGYFAPAAQFGLYAHYTPPGSAKVDEPIDHAAFFVSDAGGKFPTAGGLLPFLGQSGQPVWVLPQNSPDGPPLPWVGFGGYGVAGQMDEPAADLTVFDPLPSLTDSPTAPAVRIRFLRVTAPAQADFALWQINSGAAPELFFSNRPGTAAPQEFGLRRGEHAHFNWGFSKPGHYRVHLRIEGSIGGVPVPAGDFAIDFAVSTLPGYEVWRRAGERFSAAERDAREIGGPAADPDHDGLPNLLEYALGGEPRQSDAAAHAPALLLGGEAPTISRLRFSRIADPLLHYIVESSPDLAEWTPFWTSTGTDNTAGPVEIAAPAPLSPTEPRQFLRLRVRHVE